MTVTSPTTPLSRAESNALVLLTLSQVVLFLIPLIVLGKAIGWPASLRLPASDALPLIAAKAIFVQIGYWGYMLTAVAMVPFVVALRRYACAHGAAGLLNDTMAAFGVAAAVLKTLGIVRWLIAMPSLASLYVDTPDPTFRAVIEVSYVTINNYSGGVGELLGVQLLSGLWLVLLGLLFSRIGLRRNGIASVLLGIGFTVTALRTLVPQLDLLNAIVPPLALVWLTVLAVVFLRRA
ncbi:MAG: hypothetical protein C6Y20_10375 [Tagaea sp. CACIAM 22H2]|nr:hypothetical protein [Tagaea sp. CACIAM 22H2]